MFYPMTQSSVQQLLDQRTLWHPSNRHFRNTRQMRSARMLCDNFTPSAQRPNNHFQSGRARTSEYKKNEGYHHVARR
ncbi:unnamed protein product [Dibothriocephalus latus]|uniref:Uncharacterized protein n=1 Tax=Dibothriocephalus latus TaxID=60516 RepID=A0A3P7L6S7_DIBLA|nr:unnamed protein product [Dibothriocephalus latus]